MSRPFNVVNGLLFKKRITVELSISDLISVIFSLILETLFLEEFFFIGSDRDILQLQLSIPLDFFDISRD